MSLIQCKCGKTTNTAICDWIDNKDNPKQADRCFGAIQGMAYIKGCAYDQANSFIKGFVDKYIGKYCTICGRETPEEYQEKHHLVPKAKGGKETIIVCIDCGNQLHKLFTNKELKSIYNTVTKILANEKVKKWVEWLRTKQENRFGICMKHKK